MRPLGNFFLFGCQVARFYITIMTGLSRALAFFAGDNGSDPASDLAWVDALEPRLALISVGARYSPDQPILDRVAGCTIFHCVPT